MYQKNYYLFEEKRRPKKGAVAKSKAKKSKATKPKAKTKLGVIGLGIMGSSISSNLQKSGFDVHGVELSALIRKKMKPLLSEVHADPSAILQHSLKRNYPDMPDYNLRK